MSSILASFLLGSTLMLLFVSHVRGFCTLNGNKRLSSICQTEDNQGDSLQLRNCTISDDRSYPSCRRLIESAYNLKSSGLCHIDIELKTPLEYENLPTSGEFCRTFNYSLTIQFDKVTEKIARIKLFNNSQRLSWTNIVIRDTTFDKFEDSSLLGMMLTNNFEKTTSIHLDGVRALPTLTASCFSKMRSLQSIVINNSSIYGLAERSLQLGPKSQRVELNRVEFLDGGGLDTGAIVIYDTNDCKQRSTNLYIMINNNPNLSGGRLRSNFIQISDWPAECKRTIKLEFINNPPGRIVPPLGDFLGKIYQLKLGISIDFQLDDIDCCDQDNEWFLSLLSNQKGNNSSNSSSDINYEFTCRDLNMTLDNYIGRSREKNLCPKHPWQTALTWIIILILLLATILFSISYVCIYHLIPKKSPVILVQGYNIWPGSRSSHKASGAGSGVSSQPSEQHLELTSTQLEVPAPKGPVDGASGPATKQPADTRRKPGSAEMGKKSASPVQKRRKTKSNESTNHPSDPQQKAKFKLPRATIKLPKFRSADKHKEPDDKLNRATKSPVRSSDKRAASNNDSQLHRITDRSQPVHGKSSVKLSSPKPESKPIAEQSPADQVLAQGKQISKSIGSAKSIGEPDKPAKSPVESKDSKTQEKAAKKSSYSDRMSLALRTIK